MEYMKAIDKLLAPIKKSLMNALVANSRWLDSQVKKYNILYTKAANKYNSHHKRKSHIKNHQSDIIFYRKSCIYKYISVTTKTITCISTLNCCTISKKILE